MEWLSGGPAFNFITLLLSVLPLIGGLLFRRRVPPRELTSLSIAAALERRPNDREGVGRYRAIVAVWNSGGETLRASDMAANAPLVLVLPKAAEAYRAFARPTLAAASASIECAARRGTLVFDFIEPEQGIYVDVDFEGPGSPAQVLGHVIGGGSVRSIRPSLSTPRNSRLIVAGAGALGGIVGLFLLNAMEDRVIAVLATLSFSILWTAGAWQMTKAFERGRTMPRPIAEHVWAQIKRMGATEALRGHHQSTRRQKP